MVTILTFLHVLVCILLILVVLMQSGKGGGLGDVFGGGATQSFLGSGSGKNVLTRITYGLFAGFLVISVLLAIVPQNSSHSDIRERLKKDLQATPVTGTDTQTRP